MRKATDVMKIDMDIVSQTSESFLSNVFRYKMIQAIDAVWIDCDAYCHKPFPDEMQNIFAGHGFRGALNCGVVYIPPKGELIHQLLDYYENLPDAPLGSTSSSAKSWKSRIAACRRRFASIMPSARPLRPQAFTWFAQQTGDFEKALTPITSIRCRSS